LLRQPRPYNHGQGTGVDLLEHTLKGRITGRVVTPIFLIGLAAQGPELALRQFLAGVLKGA